jgi:hypothetical protein
MALRSARFAGDALLEACIAGRRILAYGAQGESVREVQQLLIDLGYPIPDGATAGFYKQTQAAVRAFQVAHGLAADAKIGPSTMGALDAAAVSLSVNETPPSPPPPPPPDHTARAVGVDVAATDWQCVGVAQVGAAVFAAGAIYCFEFRSTRANVRGQYLFIGGGLGLGGSLGGGTAPSPANFARNEQPDLWTPLTCARPFSANDLDKSYAALSTIGALGAYGYSLTRITAGWTNPLFLDQDVSGWGTGVGAGGAMMPGIWLRIGVHGYY